MRDNPTEANIWCNKNDPGRKANETCMRKTTRWNTCFAEAHAHDGGHSERITRSLSRLGDGKVTVNDSVSMIQLLSLIHI